MTNRRPDTLYIAKPLHMEGPFKVGIATDVQRRVRHLSNASPFPLELVCSLPGTVEDERRIHAFLRNSHTRCEWFRNSPKIHTVIDWMKAGCLDHEALPAPIRIDALKGGRTAAEWRMAAAKPDPVEWR